MHTSDRLIILNYQLVIIHENSFFKLLQIATGESQFSVILPAVRACTLLIICVHANHHVSLSNSTSACKFLHSRRVHIFSRDQKQIRFN